MAMVSVIDKYSSSYAPKDRFGNELLVSDGNGDNYGEMTVEVDSDQAADRMLHAYMLALAEQNGDGHEIIDECQEYLEAIRSSEQELEGQHPTFSYMVDKWVHDEIRSDSASTQAVSNLDKAHMYQRLLKEINDDYREVIEAGDDIRAIAEWDVVSRIIEGRIEENTVLDMIEVAKSRYGLAA